MGEMSASNRHSEAMITYKINRYGKNDWCNPDGGGFYSCVKVTDNSGDEVEVCTFAKCQQESARQLNDIMAGKKNLKIIDSSLITKRANLFSFWWAGVKSTFSFLTGYYLLDSKGKHSTGRLR